MRVLDCVNANIFHHTQKKFEMIIGPKLDRVNRPSDFTNIQSSRAQFYDNDYDGVLFQTPGRD